MNRPFYVFSPLCRYCDRLLFSILLSLLFVLFGCATHDAQRHIENVAKEWCMTIRASQVIPVYPLTADLQVGDVFLVRTPASTQEKQYKERGFLSLDDHRHRIEYNDYSAVYFDGYWKDVYGATPHASPVSLGVITNSSTLTPAEAPRVMFPTYSFRAESGYGLSAAFPIEGIPVALSFLGNDQVNGSVSISDARTYGGDESELHSKVLEWAADPVIRSNLTQTAKFAAPVVVYLRVVTRVYLARSMDVSLFRAAQRGGSIKAGIGSDISPLQSVTNFIVANSNLLASLNQATNPLSAANAGGSFKFTSANESSVGLKQNFDQLLAIGYLAFDVPIYENGELGVPLPTFQRLEGKTTEWLRPILETRDNSKLIREIAVSNPARAVSMMREIVKVLQSSEFRSCNEALSGIEIDNLKSDDSTIKGVEIKKVKKAITEYRRSTFAYLSRPYWFSFHAIPQRLKQYNTAFDNAYAKAQPPDVATTKSTH